jgi:hypothetical protein
MGPVKLNVERGSKRACQGQAEPVRGRAGFQCALESPGPKNSFGWAHVNKITYAPVFYTALCVKCLMRASPLRGVGPGP